MERSLVIQDEQDGQHSLKRLLEAQGYNVEVIGDSAVSTQSARNSNQVAIILDLSKSGSLPHDGFTGSGAEPAPTPLVFAIRSSDRARPRPTADEIISFGEVTVDFSRMELTRGGQSTSLTKKEFETLRFLWRNPERVISRQELLNEVWGYKNYGSTRIVDNVILKLRHKLEKEPTRPLHLRTVQGMGYRFVP